MAEASILHNNRVRWVLAVPRDGGEASVLLAVGGLASPVHGREAEVSTEPCGVFWTI